MQYANFMIQGCKLRQVLNLNKLDVLSMLVAGLAHDLGHDGFTNGYHQNAVTDRGISSNDKSIQEFFHAAELFKILADPESNMIEKLTRD